MINKRFADIVKLLLDQDTYITIKQIADHLEVSNKTIRNDLAQIDGWIKEKGLTLIKKPSVGICIEGDATSKLRLLNMIQEKNKHMVNYSPDARKIYIGIKLILNPKSRIYELAEELYVSRATIHKDLLALEKIFTSHRTQLQRQNNRGIVIEGSEKNKRHLLMDLMTQDNGYQTFCQMVKNTDFACDGSLPFAAFDFNDDEIKEFLKVLENTGNPYLHSLLFPSLVQVVLLMMISFYRIRENYPIALSQEFVQSLEKEPCYQDVQDLCKALEDHYHIPIDDMEQHYLQVFFLSFRTNLTYQCQNHDDAQFLSDQLIADWGQQLACDFSQDKVLAQAVFNHLCPSITRFKYNIMIENPLMHDIESIYPNTFKIVKKSMPIIEDYLHCKISDDEIGFFALHLAAALDRRKEPLRVLLVTHTTIGASNLLKQKLSRQFPEISIEEMATYVGIHDASLEGIDLVITTIPFDKPLAIDHLLINPLLYDYDILRLKKIIRRYYNIKNDPAKALTTGPLAHSQE